MQCLFSLFFNLSPLKIVPTEICCNWYQVYPMYVQMLATGKQSNFSVGMGHIKMSGILNRMFQMECVYFTWVLWRIWCMDFALRSLFLALQVHWIFSIFSRDFSPLFRTICPRLMNRRCPSSMPANASRLAVWTATFSMDFVIQTLAKNVQCESFVSVNESLRLRRLHSF